MWITFRFASSKGEGISFVAFYPNMSFVPGLLQNLVLYLAARARWVAEDVFGDDWDTSFEKALKQKLRMMSLIRASAKARTRK